MQRTTGVVMVLLAAVGFGTIGIFGKLATAAGLNNATLLTIRFTLATVVMLVYLGRGGRTPRPRGRRLAATVGLGIPYAVMTGAYFWSLLYLPAGLAAITLYTYPVYVYVVSAALLGERLTGPKVFALLLALAGVALIIGLDTSGADPFGLAIVSVAATAYAAYTVGSRIAVDTIDPDQLATSAMATTGACTLGYGLFAGTLSVPTTTEQWGIILGLTVVGTVLPLVLFVNGLRFVEASRASVVTTAEPVVTVVLGVVVLGERFSPGVVAGGTLVLVGILLIQSDGLAGSRTPAGSEE